MVDKTIRSVRKITTRLLESVALNIKNLSASPKLKNIRAIKITTNPATSISKRFHHDS
jgi:hypothetical protein